MGDESNGDGVGWGLMGLQVEERVEVRLSGFRLGLLSRDLDLGSVSFTR